MVIFMEKIKRLAGSTPVMMGLLLCFWGSYATLSKFVLLELDNLQLNFYLFLFGLIVFPIFNGRLMRPVERMARSEILVVVLSGLCFFAYYFTYAYALNFIPAVEASMINYLFPIMIVVFAIFIHGEKLTWKKAAAIILGFLGVAVIATNGNLLGFRLSNPVGDLMALAAAMSWGLFSNLGKWLKRNNVLCNYLFIAMAFVLSAIAMFTMSGFKLPSVRSLLLLALMALTNLTLGLSIWMRILKTVPTTLVACMTFITPFINLLFITVFLGERMTGMQLVGALLVVLGIAVQSGILSRLRFLPQALKTLRLPFRRKK